MSHCHWHGGDRQRQGDDSSPGVADNNGMLHFELKQGLVQEFSLLIGGPHRSQRPVAVTKTGTVENDDAMTRQQQVRHATGVPVFTGDHVAVNKNDLSPFSSVAVTETNAIDVEEQPFGRMLSFGAAGDEVVGEGHRPEGGERHQAPAAASPDLLIGHRIPCCCTPNIVRCSINEHRPRKVPRSRGLGGVPAAMLEVGRLVSPDQIDHTVP
jgi:hypothetical protein